ncbi:MAG: RNA-directed DNA polymerase [Ardenticatenaceae bacterium]|nr:RNA-directed DNA polymerase [Ardenticatenaceae bacterium]
MVYIYKIEPNRRYTIFSIPKHSKGERKISVPFKSLKFIQKKLSNILQTVYEPSIQTHGFIQERSILTNAKLHSRKKYVLNLDLKDFFPSINFGRVRGLFIHHYNFSPAIATVLAQICCFDNQLPQGSPTSPIISNMICSRMDNELAKLAKRYNCIYSRYADDLTFSTSEYYFPHELARTKIVNNFTITRLGEELRDTIEDNGFRINNEKVRLQKTNERQIVTGLVVNKFPNTTRKYVRQIRAMLYAWGKFGLQPAEEEYFKKYDKKYRAPYKIKPSYKNIVRGKIAFLGMVKGKEDKVFIRYWNQLVALAPEFGKPIVPSTISAFIPPIIYTEGKTDPKHMEAALQHLKKRGTFHDLIIKFHQEEGDSGLGHDNLLKMCQNFSKTPNSEARIFLFDRDVPGNVKSRVTGKGEFKSWGNNVFSFLLPIPTHRENNADSVCIELYFEDKDLMLKDEFGRRIFLNREFSNLSGRHKSLDLICSDRNKIKSSLLEIIDSSVYDSNDQNVALSKNDFSNLILERKHPFDQVDFSAFLKIFKVIGDIISKVNANA